jgi:hypothetical protein
MTAKKRSSPFSTKPSFNLFDVFFDLIELLLEIPAPLNLGFHGLRSFRTYGTDIRELDFTVISVGEIQVFALPSSLPGRRTSG